MVPYIFISILVVIVAYLLGNLNVSILISKMLRRDIRKEGSGNPGTMNMFRTFGIKWGLVTLICDALRGTVAGLIGWFFICFPTNLGQMYCFGADKFGLFIAGLFVVLGHIFPAIYKFKGGKGVAVSVGLGFVAQPLIALGAFVIALIFFLTVKIGSLTSFIAIGIPLIFSGVVAIVEGRLAEGVLAIVIYAIVLIAHHANFVRLFTGKEKKIELFKKKKAESQVEQPTDENTANN